MIRNRPCTQCVRVNYATFKLGGTQTFQVTEVLALLFFSSLTSLKTFLFSKTNLRRRPDRSISISICAPRFSLPIFPGRVSVSEALGRAAERETFSFVRRGSWRFCLALFSERGIVGQGGAVEALLKITSEEGRGDVSSDTVATLCFLPCSLLPSYPLPSMNQERRDHLSPLL